MLRGVAINIDFRKLSASQRYFAMVQTIIPRPIAWVLTRNDSKKRCKQDPVEVKNNEVLEVSNERIDQDDFNLAPYSFFTGICSDPPLVMISAGKKPSGAEHGKKKDTAYNIQNNGLAVIHLASSNQLQEVNDSAATLDYGESELKKLGLDVMPIDGFELPRLSDSKVALACKLYKIDEIGSTPQTVIYLEIVSLFVNDELLLENEQNRLTIDSKSFDPLARLGGSYYSALGEVLSVNRPK